MSPALPACLLCLFAPRPIFSRLTQVLTGHAFIGEYYKRFVPDKNTFCPCGKPLQTRQHILLDRPDYADFHHLFITDRGDKLFLPDILGTPRGIEKLTVFLERTTAFTKQH
ncbi:hypothetical protein RhiLY_12532 [Ceratobasidium sp. AG-Ba]|nr:hypothetical protein RhiLY_12532 [Ceratobasidium sp. AG-Ba]